MSFKLILSSILFFLFTNISSQELEEWKIKRKNVFEFTQKPTITKNGNGYDIKFVVKDFCDITVVIEDDNRKIIRHLISGVLGDNPPEPLTKNSLSQKVYWDGKTDHGRYLNDLSKFRIRVSLGLKAKFDKVLFHSPYKRMSRNAPVICSDKDGVYIWEGLGHDFIRQFNHNGNYVKTIYPFAYNKLKDIKGLSTFKSPLDGKTYPQKLGFNQATLLTSGTNALPADFGGHLGGYAALCMATQNGHIALAYNKINRLGTDGTTKGMELTGPIVSYNVGAPGKKQNIVGPTSISFSPDNKYIYMTGFVFKTHVRSKGDAFHVVTRQEYGTNKPPEVFKGKELRDKGIGSDDNSFALPTSVAIDAKGRIYVSDYGNSRIQVFNAEGKLLKSIKCRYPSYVTIDKKSQEIFAFTWSSTIGVSNKLLRSIDIRWSRGGKNEETFVNLGTFEKPLKPKRLPLPLTGGSMTGSKVSGKVYQIDVNSYGKKQRIWISSRIGVLTTAEIRWGASAAPKGANLGIRIFEKQKGKWTQIKNFAEDAAKKVKRLKSSPFAAQRLYFNPSDDHLYVGEDEGFWKSFDELVKINPENGNVDLVKIPFDFADIVFGYNDIVYGRTHYAVMRFNSKTWKEIPYDYGNEMKSVHFQTFSAPRRTVDAVSAMVIPGGKPVHWQLSGMNLNFKGELALVCYTRDKKIDYLQKDKYKTNNIGKKYTPNNFPGRYGSWVVHVFDKYGKVIKQDRVPGMPGPDGIGIDQKGDIYVLIKSPRILPSGNKVSGYTETLMKVAKKENRFISDSSRASVALDPSQKPKRPKDIQNHWVENVQWMYGGVAHGGNGGCTCWHSRFALDYLGRSFVPESNHYQVGILDSNGNLILRVGQYGNQDSAGPNSKVPLKGDGVGIFMANYVTSHTDHRLFIADKGNERILSVNLLYETEVTIKLK